MNEQLAQLCSLLPKHVTVLVGGVGMEQFSAGCDPMGFNHVSAGAATRAGGEWL